ncbi:hypothetical protein QUC31_003656 [Theobroma cacao]|uniref:Uncharacterized protein isoform 1 n=1 Tax=Theobroma cacao TaxID=3641 RepID=A0A061DR92_THECC|nr:Uncharacterized protein TCM_001427 isoform 1 [Theobroma cacao]WRX08518.1 Protein of unknown function PDDEXK-like - like 1 [Theobroma cacao]
MTESETENISHIPLQRHQHREIDRQQMGSLKEEELVQMVQDYIESESPSPIFPDFSNRHLPSFNHLSEHSALQEILRSRTETEREVLEHVLKHIKGKRDVHKTSGLKKWLAMRLKMNGFNASFCQTSWATSLGCPGGDYEYIAIVVENENGTDTVRLIVDIDFKSQFELARPTPTYKELTDALPSIFVGSEEKLNKIISVLCSAAKQSFREAGLHVPPWRTSTYMKSKWLSGGHKVAANNAGLGRENREEETKGGAHSFSKWAPPMVKAKRRDLGGGGSALSSQFSSMGINCC